MFPSFAADSMSLLRILLDNLVKVACIAGGASDRTDAESCDGNEHDSYYSIVIGLGIDRATEITKFMFDIFREFYLSKLIQSRQVELSGKGLSNVHWRWHYGAFPSWSALSYRRNHRLRHMSAVFSATHGIVPRGKLFGHARSPRWVQTAAGIACMPHPQDGAAGSVGEPPDDSQHPCAELGAAVSYKL